MLELLYATGCRASELSSLRLCDMHLDEGYCICRGKGDKQRLVPFGGRAIAAVEPISITSGGSWRPGGRRRRPIGSCSPSAAAACGASGSGNC